MCTILKDKIKGKRKITGYKIVLKKGDKYYSPITGIEYIPGEMIPKIDKADQCVLKHTSHHWTNPLELFKYLFRPNFVGYTTVFKNIKDAREICHMGEKIVLMTLSVSLHYARYDFTSVYVGKRVVKIEEI